LHAGAVGTPATPGYSLPINGRSSDTPICYSGQAALRREKSGISAESQNCEVVARNGSANTLIARQWLSSRHVMAITDMHTTVEELLEAVFSVHFMPRLYKKDQLPLPVS
jgi:hypothetical protein